MIGQNKVFTMLPSCSFVEELHRMPFCEQESSLPPDELLEMFSLALAIAPAMSVAGVVLCWFGFIALSACVSECVVLCVRAQSVRADIEALPFHKWAVENLQVGPSASCTRVRFCA